MPPTIITAVPIIGTQFINHNNIDEALFLPFVPSETSADRQMDWATVAPAGMSGTFQVSTQGGSERLNLDLFLNDRGRKKDDYIIGEHSGQTTSDFNSVENVQGALEWFETVRKARTTIDGVVVPPAILQIIIANRDAGLFVINSYNTRIVSRRPRSASSRPGDPDRAYVRMEMTAFNQIPFPTHAYRW
jgi:hypothetical protein